jgi:hypothetical protein
MKKLHPKEQKSIIGGGPCGRKLCNDSPSSGWLYTGSCGGTLGCNSAYVVTVVCGGTSTYCSTGLQPA